MSDLAFRPLHRDDLPELERWLSQPHVDEWWHQSLDSVGVRAKYLPRIDGTEPTHVFIIEHAGRAIGWIQWYRWADYPAHAGEVGAGATTAGVDLAIGDATLLGRGIGSRALATFVEQIVFADPAITACLSDPEARNVRSVRAFENAGFVVVRTAVLAGEHVARCIVQRDR
jgi:RimJ/RimL family protein N-acetyltransferase